MPFDPALLERDPDLAALHARYGPPPAWRREPGFAGLVRIILAQQVSFASAEATYGRLEAALGGEVTPERFLEQRDESLRGLGLSRQKTRYGRSLAEEVASGRLDFGRLEALGDDAVRAALVRLTGVGRWTAEVYLLMALSRPDVFPAQDLALLVALERFKGLSARPTPAAALELAEAWRPYRSSAAFLLWHAYLESGRESRKGGEA